MKFFAAKNLTEQTVEPCVPWEFQITTPIPENVRKVKADRQAWYKAQSTDHCFYTGIEGFNPALRIGRDNPVRAIHSFVVDYDVVIPDERIAESVQAMKVKPVRVETSLGNHRRLVWQLAVPISTDGTEFASLVQKRAVKWLNLNLLPGLDEPAFTTCNRLYCVGDKWEDLGHGPIPLEVSQPFFMECGKAFRFQSNDEIVIALNIVEAELKKLYPKFDWPTEFVEGSQGPSFWVEGSQSTNSAIVKPEGLFTFAAHAEKPFYTWGDLLGKEFVKKFAHEVLTRATADVWFDGKKYHRRNKGVYISMEKPEFLHYLKLTCNLSPRPDNTGNSAIEKVVEHVYHEQRIYGAAPFVPRPMGPVIFMRRRYLNIYDGKVLEPAEGAQVWGPNGNCPWLSALFATEFTTQIQFDHFHAWAQYYVQSLIDQTPRPGQAIFLAGPPGCGKTFISRQVLGQIAGGFMDASSLFIERSAFNSELLLCPHWVLDDDGVNQAEAANFAHMLMKKIVANQEFSYHKKYEVPSPAEWAGRLCVTLNLTEDAMRMVGPMEDGTDDKVNLYRCRRDEERGDFKFFSTREETYKRLMVELPFWMRALLDWKVPDTVKPCPRGRYGWKAYQEPSLCDSAGHTSPATTFHSIFSEALIDWFKTMDSSVTVWTGSTIDALRLIVMNPANAMLRLPNLTPDRVGRMLDRVHREKTLECSHSADALGIRKWVFPRAQFDNLNQTP